MIRNRFTCTVALLFVVASAVAQKAITIDDFTIRPTFLQRSVSGINWMKDGKFYTSLQGNKIVKFDVTTGKAVETLLDGDALSLEVDDYEWSADEKKLMILSEREGIYRRSYKGVYHVYDIASKSLRKLTTEKSGYATFSPDATRAAFVRHNNVYVVNLSDLKETPVTTDGRHNEIINGSTDWVYEEELGFAQAFYWSPDGRYLAYYRFDESRVREYNMQKWNRGQLYPEDYRFKYPKAGEANALVDIFIRDVNSGVVVKADLGTETDRYIPRVKWTTTPGLLWVRTLNRLQNEMTLYHVNAATGAATFVQQEKSDTYVDVEYTDDLIYTQDQKYFISASERSGYKHLYLNTTNGQAVNPITAGDWEVTQLVSVDEKARLVYYISTEGNYLNRTFYSVSFDGKRKTKLSAAEGTHTINMSPDHQYYIDYHTTADQPLVVTLFKTKGNAVVKVLESNEALKKTLDEYGIVKKEFFQYKSADGSTLLDGFLIKPRNFDASRQYPVLVYQYSGPRAPSVLNAFSGGNFYWFQMLAQKGIIVAVIDTRGTGFRGEKFAKMTYKQLGKFELEDLLAGAKHLGALDYIDDSRIALHGWSYGGYMTSLAMTKGAGVYKVGIAGAPVTNWRYYDTIYTERFLQTPQQNASGYDDNSPTTHAANLKGDFLLIHGTGDDNVHFQNSVALEDALIRAGKQFRSFYYPDLPHGWGGKPRHHLMTLMTDFLLEKL